MTFHLFLVGFLEKGMKSANLEIFGVLRPCVGIPRSGVGPRQGVACPHRGMDKMRLGQASGTPRHSKATPQRRPTPQHSIIHKCMKGY